MASDDDSKWDDDAPNIVGDLPLQRYDREH